MMYSFNKSCENAQPNFGFERTLLPHFSITVERTLIPHFSITVEHTLIPHYSITVERTLKAHFSITVIIFLIKVLKLVSNTLENIFITFWGVQTPRC